MMNDKETYQSNINLINETFADTRFVLDDAKPKNGICKTLFNWSISFFCVSFILSILPKIAQNLQWIESPTYYSFYRVFYIILYIIPIIIYILSTYKIKMTLKEQSFLNMFIYIPIFISIFKILFPIAFYLNVDFFLSLYSTIPIDIIFLILGLIQLYFYFKNRNIAILIVFPIIYIIFFSVVKIIGFQQIEVTAFTEFILKLKNIIDMINNYAIFQTVLMLITIFFIKRSNDE